MYIQFSIFATSGFYQILCQLGESLACLNIWILTNGIETFLSFLHPQEREGETEMLQQNHKTSWITDPY